MKQIIACIALCGLSFTSMAQGSSKAVATSTDKVTMKNGKMMLTSGGKTSELTKDFTSANGHIFKPNGTMVLNTGVGVKLQEGQSATLDGKLEGGPAKTAPKVNKVSSK